MIAAVGTLFWGYAVRSVGKFQLNTDFLWRLGTNPWFIFAMLSALSGTVVTYYVIAALGVAKGRLFLSVQSIAILVTSYFVLGEQFTTYNIAGVVLVLIGALLLV